ncbi:MAG TPA: CaiB/BaiF CoA-transferase family protein [Xanthobacteraceae bacterium]|nr:CaiB/BaiF CoA-transferase family protein [Xanthobacteraceae bacterium]
MPGPLSHIKVLDLSRVMAGPWIGQMLADFGADVIKVERPGAGDDTRGWGPPFLKDKDGKDTQESGYYLSVNRGKRSLTINIDKPEGQELVRKLAAKSDILLENFKLGTLPRYGLGYDDLKKVNPRLIYCAITGFGQNGPWAPKVAYDFLIQAMGGLMSITGEAEGRPGGGPQKVGIPILDLTTGMYGAVAVLAALAHRDVTGKGNYIDLAMLDVQTAFLSNQAMNYLLSGRTPQRQGNRHPNIVPQDVFMCRDGAVVLAVGNDSQFAKMCTALNRPEVGTDPRYAKNSDRIRHKEELMTLIAEIFAQWSRADLVAAMEKVSVPCGSINSIPEVFEQEQIKHRQMRMDLPHPRSGTVPSVKNPINFSETPLSYERAPPTLGQHSDEVLRELGLSDGDIDDLRRNNII